MLVTCPRPVMPAALAPKSSTTEQHEAASATSRITSASTSNSHVKTAAPKWKSAVAHDFKRWRPTFHLIAPKNWMNDPCGPCFDERTGLFHVLYQYNPHGATWGNMSWLHATSNDLVRWSHVNEEPSLVPEQEHDKQGVFSGAMVPHGPKGERDMLTVFYTAVSFLPIHFTKPYHWGSEKLAMATSTDGGVTWQRSSDSVLIDSPPKEHEGNVASWRDPFISAWPEMDVKLGLPHGQFVYGVVSGSIRGKTPTAFLYKIEKANMANWTYVSTIADVGLHFSLGSASGDMGHNWEVCNFFSLKDDQFLLMNVEGAGKDLKSRYPMWTQVSFDEREDATRTHFVPQKSGLIDHGCLYAATTFYHAPTKRRIMWGWITEDDLDESRYDQQGWSGCISLPREITRLKYTNVHPSMVDHPLVKPSFAVEASTGKGFDMSTVGFLPAQETVALREGATHVVIDAPALAQKNEVTLPIKSRTFELKVDFAVHGSLHASDEFGLFLAHNGSKTQGTKIVYRNEAVHVIRAISSTDPDVKKDSIVAPMPLLRFADGTTEDVQMHVFLDNSVLEVFVNNRTVITTRIYCDNDHTNMVSVLCNGRSRMHSKRAEAWIGLQHAMLDPRSSKHIDMADSTDSDIAHL